MKEYTGAGVIFGVTGGVMEAALRSAYYLVTGKNPDPDAFQDVRNDGKGVKSAEIRIGDAVVKAAVVSGLGNTRCLLQQIERGDVHYDFVEVMACPGGCVAGAGTMQAIKKSQTAVNLYAKQANHRVSCDTEHIKELDKLVD